MSADHIVEKVLFILKPVKVYGKRTALQAIVKDYSEKRCRMISTSYGAGLAYIFVSMCTAFSLHAQDAESSAQGAGVSLGFGARPTTCIPFVGNASGGTVILADTSGINAPFVTVETAPGESAEIVAARLARAINEGDPFDWYWFGAGVARPVTSSGGAICGLLGGPWTYLLAGTESGLGVPPAPISLTCNYDREARQIRVQWENSATDYDSLRLYLRWSNWDHSSSVTLSGTDESYANDLNITLPEEAYVIEAWSTMPADLDVWLVAVRQETPSNAAGMHVSYHVQEERYGIPFSNNTAPNWTAWSLTPMDVGHLDAGVRERLTAEKNNPVYNNVDSAHEKPFYQILKPHQGGPAGITRSFLGLTPGHKYRVTIRMNTYGVDAKSANWAYSFHAVCTGLEDRPLSPQQMAGQTPLPARGKGFEESRVVQYDDNKRTKNAYKEATRDLVVPEEADAITVWLSFQSARSADYVTMDYIKLEDLGKQ
jgi:hypothetical protein